MIDEMTTLHANNTEDLVPLPPRTSHIDCLWIYTIKVGPDDQVNWLKAYLVTKRYTQLYELDLMAKLSSIHLFLVVATIRNCLLYQLGIKNTFLYGKLHKEIYIDQLHGFDA